MAASSFKNSSQEKAKTFTSQKHAKLMLKSLNNTRKNSNLCDAIVVIGEHRIPVQKSVLAAASDYMRLVFSYGETDRSTMSEIKCMELDLTSLHIDVETFHALLDYIYTSDIQLSEDNIQDIFQAADILLIADLKDICCEYMEGCISPYNCLGILEFASRFSCSWIHLKVSQYVDEHFREVMYGDEFLQLSAERLSDLLNRDMLCVSKEEDIVEAILRWHSVDPILRAPSIKDLVISCLRHAHISKHFLMNFMTNTKLSNASDIVDHIVKCQNKKPELRPRGFTNVLVVLGGEAPVRGQRNEEQILSTSRCVVLSSQTSDTAGKWMELAPMLKERIGHGVVVVGGCLYVVGGRDCRNSSYATLNTGEKYDALSNTWTSIASMQHARMGLGLVAVDENIYALGSSSDMNAPVTSVEVYNIFSNKWQSAPEMNLRRVWSSYAAVDKKIYVIAGGAIGKLFESVECFDTRTETWVSLSPMRERRCDARAVTVDEEIFVFGGVRRIECPSAMHGGQNLKFCGTEIYSTINDNWTPLQLPSRGIGVCTMGDTSGIYGAFYDGQMIYVVGELDIGGKYNCIRAFNIQTRTWHSVVENHPPNQRGFACGFLQFPSYKLLELECS